MNPDSGTHPRVFYRPVLVLVASHASHASHALHGALHASLPRMLIKLYLLYVMCRTDTTNELSLENFEDFDQEKNQCVCDT